MDDTSATRKLRVAVIGLGPIGNLHANIYHADNLAELVGVCDVIPEKAKATGERLDVPWFTDAAQMLAALAPDLCSVATGGFEYGSDHYVPTIQALEAGCHVMCEKPICNAIDKAAEMVRVARDRQRCFAVDFNHRFTPAAYLAKQWLDEGQLGDLLFVNMALWIGKPGEYGSPYFQMKALNPHSIDMMRHFCGDIVKVQCFATRAPGRDLWSTASWNFLFANGMVGHLTSSYDIERGHPMERCEVAGTKGRFIIDDMWREVTLFPAGDKVKSVYTNPVFGGYRDFDDTFRARLHAFVEQVANGATPDQINGSGVDALAAQTVIAAAIESLESGEVVEVEKVRVAV